jgi:hypothetical protein
MGIITLYSKDHRQEHSIKNSNMSDGHNKEDINFDKMPKGAEFTHVSYVENGNTVFDISLDKPLSANIDGIPVSFDIYPRFPEKALVWK